MVFYTHIEISSYKVYISCPIYKNHGHSKTLVIFVLGTSISDMSRTEHSYICVLNVLGGKNIFMFLKI